MSQVRIQGNASGTGTLTIASPNTNSDFTLNLPASAGTIPVLSSVTNNGVVFINGSGQATSGSALTFDGTSLAIGTGTATNLLTLLATSTPGIDFLNGAGTKRGVISASSSALNFNSLTTNPITWQIDSSEQMRLTSTGLGIGTSSPGTKLDVSGNLRFSAANPVIELNNGGAQIYSTVANTLQFASGGGIGSPIERARIDSSGNLELFSGAAWTSSGIGPTGKQLTFGYDTTNSIGYVRSANNGTTYTPLYLDGSIIRFNVGNSTLSEVARIDSSGNLLVGTTSLGANANYFAASPGNAFLDVGHATGVASSTPFARFLFAGSSIGSITQNGTTAVAYNTSSDYRLKENIQPMTGALAKVAALKPCTYKWKADGSDGEGFIAHELAEVVPQCVTGEKDAVDADGNPVYQGIDTSFLVATLTAAIQEHKAETDAMAATIESQQALIAAQAAALTDLITRIAALEAK